MPAQRFYTFDLSDEFVCFTFPDNWLDKARDLQEHLSNGPHDWNGYYDVFLEPDIDDVDEPVFLRVTVDDMTLYERTYDGDMPIRLADDPSVQGENPPLSEYDGAVFSSMVLHYVLKERDNRTVSAVKEQLHDGDGPAFDRAVEHRRAERSSGRE